MQSIYLDTALIFKYVFHLYILIFKYIKFKQKLNYNRALQNLFPTCAVLNRRACTMTLHPFSLIVLFNWLYFEQINKYIYSIQQFYSIILFYTFLFYSTKYLLYTNFPPAQSWSAAHAPWRSTHSRWPPVHLFLYYLIVFRVLHYILNLFNHHY